MQALNDYTLVVQETTPIANFMNLFLLHEAKI